MPARLLANLQLQSAACPDARNCFAVGSHIVGNGPDGLVILATHDGGASWSTVRTQPGLMFGLLSCSGTHRCYLVGGSYAGPPQSLQVSLLITADGGKSWRRGNMTSLRRPGFMPGRLACPSITVCFLAGMVFSPAPASVGAQRQALLAVTKDGGKSWTEVGFPGNINLDLLAMACASVTSCDVGGVTHEKSCFQAGAILHSDDGGKTWVRQFGDCATAISVLACPTARSCYAGGWYGAPDAAGNQLVLHTGDGGTIWDDELEGPIDPAYRPDDSIPEPIGGIACPDAQICSLTAGSRIVATTDGGATWRIQTPAGGAVLTSIACPTTRVCVSVGWIQSPLSGPGLPQSTGLILRTADGGKTWTKS